MRDIRFRATRTDNGEWAYGSLIDSGNHEQVMIYPHYDGASTMGVRQLVYHSSVAVDPDTVGEWTGLVDKNGEKIFEGNVVKGADFQADDGYAKIKWDDDAARFVILGYGLVCDFDNYYGYELEVIGNIYDNPDSIEW